MYIQREIQEKIKPFLKRKEVLAVLGARQTGKTTFLQHLFSQLKKGGKSVKLLTFEKRSDLALFNNDIEDFKDIYKKYDVLIIDEFQYAEKGGQKLKYLFDTTKTKYIISGSSSLELTFKIGKYMVGRMFRFFLWPFSFREYLSCVDKEMFDLLKQRVDKSIFLESFKAKNLFGAEVNSRLEKLFEKYLIFGGYPAVVLSKNQLEKRKVLESIFENYLLKDIKSLLQLATENELVSLVKFLANQMGSLIRYKELSNNANLNYKNLLKHLEILKQTYIIDLIKPYFTNQRTELTKNPKAYFIDSGFRNFILSDFRAFNQRKDVGNLVENQIFMFLKRQNNGLEKINFWRTKSKAEIDFIISRQNRVIPIEVKYSSQPNIGKSMYSFIEKFSVKQAFIFTKGYADRIKVNGCWVNFIPVWYL